MPIARLAAEHRAVREKDRLALLEDLIEAQERLARVKRLVARLHNAGPGTAQASLPSWRVRQPRRPPSRSRSSWRDFLTISRAAASSTRNRAPGPVRWRHEGIDHPVHLDAVFMHCIDPSKSSEKGLEKSCQFVVYLRRISRFVRQQNQ